MSGRLWTAAELTRLRADYETGVHRSVTADALNRSYHSVYKKAANIGLALWRPELWSDADDAVLIAGYEIGTPHRTLAATLRRTHYAVKSRAKRLRLVSANGPRAIKRRLDALASHFVVDRSTIKKCQFIDGDPRGEYSFCNERVAEGKPYCQPHCDDCYREDIYPGGKPRTIGGYR